MPLPIDVRDRELRAPERFDIEAGYRTELEGILLSRGELEDGVSRLAAAVTDAYRGNPDFYPVCVLKGAMRFFVDLLRELDLGVPYSEGMVYSSRYQSGPITETPAMAFFQEEHLAGKDVLLVEDVLDEGYTLSALRERIEAFNPASVEIATLFDVTSNRQVEVDPTFDGFVLPDGFLVGYGLDYEERYRDLPHLAVLDPAVVDG